MFFLADSHFGYIKTSLFISLCILRDLPQQKITRELCSGGDRAIFLCSHVLMEQFFDGTDQENSKTQGARGQIRKIQENKKEIMEERKRRDLCISGGSHTRVFASGWGCPRATTLVGPFVRRTHSYGNVPYNITRLEKKHCSSCPHKTLNTSNNTSDSIKCQVQPPQAIIILFIVSVEGERLENVQLAKVFTTASYRKCTLTNYLTCLPFHCLKFSQKFLFDTR